MGTPQIPKGQQDALPLLTIAAATGGDVQLVGNSITRFWSATALGIVMANVSTGSVGISNQLDLRGCSQFVLILQRTPPGPDAADLMELYALYGTSAGTYPTALTVFGGAALITRIGTINYVIGEPNPMITYFAWSANTNPAANNTGASNTGTTIGTSIKLALRNTSPIATAGSYSFEMWGANQ